MSTNEIKKKVNEDNEDNILADHPLLWKSEKVHDFHSQTKKNICQNLLFRGKCVYKKIDRLAITLTIRVGREVNDNYFVICFVFEQISMFIYKIYTFSKNIFKQYSHSGHILYTNTMSQLK